MIGSTSAPPRAALLAVVLAALAGPVVVALVTWTFGVNLSPDSLTYLRGADVLARDGVGGAVSFPTALHPPGLSAALAPAAALGLTVETARWLNVALVAACAVGVGLFLVRRVRPALAVAAAALVGLGYPMVHTASWLTTEPLYIALTLLHLGLLAGLVGTRRPAALAAAAGLVAALAVIVRYAGVSIVPFGLVAVVLLAPRTRRVRQAAWYALPLALVAGGWMVRNVLITGYPTGDRASNERGGLEVAADAAGTVALWFAPPGLPERWGATVGAGAVVVVIGATVAAALRLRGGAGADDRSRLRLAALLGGYLVSSALALMVLVSATNTDRMGDRLLSPLWPALVGLAVVGADIGLDRARALDRPRKLVGVLVLVPLLAVGFTTLRTLHTATEGEQWSGAGFNGPHWQSDAVRRLVAVSPPGTLLVGNEPYGLTVVAGRDAIESPRYTAYASTEASDDSVERFVRAAATAESYLVWTAIDDVDDDHVPPPELARHVTLVPVARTPAGQAYRVLPSGPAAAPR